MSAVSVGDGDGLALVCDECGRTLTGLTAARSCWPTVLALASDQGWAGTTGEEGAHRCPACGPPHVPSVRQWGPLRVHLTDAGDTTVTVLEGDLDGRVAEGLRAAVAHAGAARRHLVLDLTAVHRIDSRGLGVLVRARQIRAAAGGCLVLAAPSRFVRTVLHTMHLDAAFPVFAHTQDALDWLGRVDSRPPNPR